MNARPGKPYGITSKNIGEIMTGGENAAEAHKAYDQQRRNNHDRFPKGGWHFRGQQVGHQPIENDDRNSMPAWETRDVHDDPDLSWWPRTGNKG